MNVTQNRLVLVYSIALITGLIGVYFSYHTDLTSSNAWRKWGNDQAWVGDSARLLALYLLAVLLITTSFRAGRKRTEKTYTIQINLRNIAVTAIFFTTALALNFYYYPIYFEKELLRTTDTYLSMADIELVKLDYYGQVYKPFFSYIFYALALWIGIILPTFLILLDGFKEDHRKAMISIRTLSDTDPGVHLEAKWNDEDSIHQFKQTVSDLGKRNQDCVQALRLIVQRYLPALLVVIIGYTIFNILLSDAAISPGKHLVKTQTAEAKSSFGWIIIIFLVICIIFIMMFARLFNSYRYSIEESIQSLKDFVSNKSLSYEYDEIVLAASEKWDIRLKNVALFIGQTLISSGSLSLPILITFAASVSWAGINGYADELIPITLRDIVTEKFIRESGNPTP